MPGSGLNNIINVKSRENKAAIDQRKAARGKGYFWGRGQGELLKTKLLCCCNAVAVVFLAIALKLTDSRNISLFI